MITDINLKEEYNATAKCWDAILTWKFKGIENKVIGGNKSDKIHITLQKLIDAQCSQTVVTKIQYRGKK